MKTPNNIIDYFRRHTPGAVGQEKNLSLVLGEGSGAFCLYTEKDLRAFKFARTAINP